MGDLTLTEVLQGFGSERVFNEAKTLLTSSRTVQMGGQENALQVARNFRILRRPGITMRKAIDAMIAATVKVCGLEVATSNVADFNALGRDVFNV